MLHLAVWSKEDLPYFGTLFYAGGFLVQEPEPSRLLLNASPPWLSPFVAVFGVVCFSGPEIVFCMKLFESVIFCSRSVILKTPFYCPSPFLDALLCRCCALWKKLTCVDDMLCFSS